MKRVKIIFFSLITIVSAIFTYKSLMMVNFEMTNEQFIKILLKDPSIASDDTTKKEIAQKAIKVLTQIEFDKPLTILGIEESQEEKTNNTVEQVISIDDNKPLVYIYNTHQQEQYYAGPLEAYNITPTVLIASYIMQEKLKENNIESIVEESNIKQLLNKKKYNYNESYKITRELINKNKKNHETIKYYIDIHRDAINKKASTVTIDGKNYAKTMFVIGMNNKNNEKNRQVFEKLNNKLNELYPNLSRGIYKRNATYNQDIDKNVILIEIGGVDNTLEEVYNSVCALSDVLSWYIKNEE